MGVVGGRDGLGLATVIGDGGAAAKDLATVGTPLGSGNGVLAADGLRVVELGAGGGALGTAEPLPLAVLGLGVEEMLGTLGAFEIALGPGGSPPESGG